jgi:4-amino-4-deoxy-L-arabinose transferase-like glycosyltransferase
MVRNSRLSALVAAVPWVLVGSLGVALVLRLLAWHWHELYPLGGDEQEYFEQALTLLREHRYTELRLMRPPLYGVFLAGCIVLVDSFVQRIRLVQALISTATVIPMWLLTAELVRQLEQVRGRALSSGVKRAAPALGALLCALSYTLAARATELLTETLFLFGLTLVLWLLVRAGTPTQQRLVSAAAGGVALGALCLVRSVALPLLVLGTLWLLGARRRLLVPLLFALGALLVVLPWSARNYATYGALIVIDTTGAENLWLDNDPAGREVVKAQLYAMGDDRAARQQLATQRGLAAIAENPRHFAGKAWDELLHFFALEYADDMRERRAIWVPPAEVWLRLLLGDGLFVLVLLAGAAGLWRVRWRSDDPRWLPGAWALYILFTSLLFHVELRYRLPLFPVLLPCAALVVASAFAGRGASHPPPLPLPRRLISFIVHPVWLILLLILLHRPYPLLAWQLGLKHLHLARAEHALEVGKPEAAREAARAALEHDEESVLARVALARAALLRGEPSRAEELLRQAIAILPAHPHPHLLLGDLLRQRGSSAAARRELAYETATLQDIQAWAWQRFTTPPSPALNVGGGLDLGMVRGFHAARENTPGRWTTDRAYLRLARPPRATSLCLRMASGRWPDKPPTRVQVAASGATEQFSVGAGWRDYCMQLPAADTGETSPLVVALRSETFTPREDDPISSDGRTLGVLLDRVEVR